MGSHEAAWIAAICDREIRHLGVVGVTTLSRDAKGSHALATTAAPVTDGPYATHAYGGAPEQVGDLWLPDGDFDPPWPVVVLVHGGFWARRHERSLMDGLAEDLAERGYAAWNVEYRRTHSPGGGWPQTFTDVAAAVDHLAGFGDDRIDLERIALVGHSAGAPMCLWAAARANRDGARHVPRLVVAQAGLLDLERAARDGLGDGAVTALLGDPDKEAARYAEASPIRFAPIRTPTLLVHGEDDDLVPASQSRAYADVASTGGDAVDLVLLPGTGHFEHVDPDAVAWDAVVDRLPAPATGR